MIYKPKSLIVDLTNKCNQKCFFCWRINKQEHLINVLKDKNIPIDFNLYKKIIDESCKIDSINWLSLSGPMGDPLLADNFLQYPRYAMSKNKFKTVLINTNGVALNNYDPKELLNSLTDIFISVDSVTPETYEKIHGNAKQLPIVLDNVKLLLSCKKDNPEIKTTIKVRFTENDHNKDEWKVFKKYFDDINCPIHHVKIHSFNGVNPERNNEIGAYLCNQPYSVINFNYKGEITTCCTNYELEPTFGSIENNSIISLYNSRKFNKWRINRMKGICSNCGGIGTVTQRFNNVLYGDEYLKYYLLKRAPGFLKNIIGSKKISVKEISWWIPNKKWRDKFRSKFANMRPDQTRPDQTRPDQTRPEIICNDYIYSYHNSKYKKIQPMLQFYIAA